MTYSDELKRQAVGVPDEVLAAHGAVSAQVALAMASGGRERTAADLAVSVTGIAGPDGGSPSKPVGLTYVAVADASGAVVRRHVWTGDRAENKRRSAAAALELLLERIEAQAAAPGRGGGHDVGSRRGPGRHMTSASERVGAGLQPVRRARPIREEERIHVVGAAGAGASAAALLAAHAGAIVTGCDPGGHSPYTPALDALGIEIAPEHSAAHVTGAARPDRLAVTKALTAIDPDQAELAAARDAGIPVEAWQQVVADAAVGRTLVGVAGTHGKSTTSGWLVHVLAGAGADPSAFVGRAAAVVDHGRPAGHGSVGEWRRLRRRGRRVRRQLRCLPSRAGDPDQRRVGPSGRLRRPGGGRGDLRVVAAPGAAGSHGRRQRRRSRRRSGPRPACRLARHDPRLRARRPGATTAGRLRPRDRRAIFDREQPGHGACSAG